MSKFNYRIEKEKFDRKWAQLEKEYVAAGMSRVAIEEMRQFDWHEFNRQRSWQNHEVPIAEILPDDSEAEDIPIDNCALGMAFSAEDKYHLEKKGSRFGWLAEISNPDLLNALLQLPEADIVILTAAFIDQMSQKEISKMVGTSQQNISKKLSRIKNYLRKF